MKGTLSPELPVAGVLAPLFAVRGSQDAGIGDTRSLRELISWAAEKGLGFVQMLPVNETGNDHSPYNLLSSMALNLLTISVHPEDLPEVPPAAHRRALEAFRNLPTASVDYQKVCETRRELFSLAFEKFEKSTRSKARTTAFLQFCEEEEEWLADHTLHHAIMEMHGSEIVHTWPEDHRSAEAAREWLLRLPAKDRQAVESRRRYHAFLQWIAHTQWRSVHEFAHTQGVALVGDVPVGVSIHSVDVWAEPHLFDLSRSCGAPPEKVFQSDEFTMQWGQNWGFPLYDWFAMSHDNFRWWRRRLQSLRQFFEVLRVDHALGFFRIYSFPWRPERNAEFQGLTPEQAAAKTGGALPGFVPHDDDTPEHRAANQIHGKTLLGILVEETTPTGLIAEDLGEVAPYVRPTLAEMGVPGFKIPQWEANPAGTGLLPGKQYPRRSITTYSTHDHPPLRTIWNQLFEAHEAGNEQASRELENLLIFCEAPTTRPKAYDAEIQKILLRGLWRSNSWLAAASLNDLLGTEDRFNTPGTSGGQNWTARISHSVADWDAAFPAALDAWKQEVKTLRPTALP